MPEGPTILLVKEALLPVIKGKIIKLASGNAKIDMSQLVNQKVLDVKTWGKHLLICLPACTIKIHFLMFGSYSIDELTKKETSVRLKLSFTKKTIYIYTSSVQLLTKQQLKEYDWEADTLSPEWNPRKARTKLKALPDTMACDALLDQQVFSGVGNIIKNEVLYRIRLHPETLAGNIPAKILSALIKEARQYSLDFLKWKRAFVLKKNLLAYTKKTCQRCDLPFTKKYCGKTKRRTFFCTNCQLEYISGQD